MGEVCSLEISCFRTDGQLVYVDEGKEGDGMDVQVIEWILEDVG